jgi:hypothetical protein
VKRNARVIAGIAAAVIAFAAVEGISRVLVRRGARAYKFYRVTPLPVFWADLDPSFGVWHPPNVRFRHAEACWDVTYQSNSYGARDVERTRRSTARRRYVVLGDSFIEGYAIRDGERLADRLNTSPNQEFLNFGTSGAFGTVQELVLYRTLASSFDHSGVLLFVLPLNDFSDNDPQYFAPSRYRPYLRRTDHGYELQYTVTFQNRDTGTLGSSMLVWNWLSDHFYLLNLGRQPIERRLRPEVQPAYTSYVGHADAELDVMAEAIRELGAAAGTRPVHVFLIPVNDDLIGYQRGVRFALPEQLRARLDGTTNVDVTDLLPDFAEYADVHHVPAAAFYLPCDAHWSSLGNAVAADAVARHLRERQASMTIAHR